MGGAVGTMWVAGRRAGWARAAADAAAVPPALHLPVTVTGEDSASGTVVEDVCDRWAPG